MSAVTLLAATSCYQGIDVPAKAGGPETGSVTADGDGDDSGDESGSDGGEPLPDPNDDPPAPGEEFECASDFQDPGPTLARRLNRAELVATLADVLGVDASDLADQMPPDYRAEGFSNTASALIVTTDDVEMWAGVAEQIVTRIPAVADFVAGHTSCTAFTAECQNEFIGNVGRKLYRRPVSASEVAALTPLFEHVAAEGDTFVDGASAVVEAMLQAPAFLYRLESQSAGDADGPYRSLDGYEIASRLSYLVLGSAPDGALLAAAEDGSLADPAARVEQVRRMLADGRARNTSLRFVSDWTHLDRLDHLAVDLSEDLRLETEAVFEELVWEEGRPLNELFDAEYTFATEALAAAYGLESAGPGLQRYDLADVPQRHGLLTQGAVLSWEDGTASMVQRGLFVLREVVCAGVAPPPAGVNDTPPDPEPGKSKRYYAEQRMATNPCGGCHTQIDPIGFAFEQYDGAGVWMQTDAFGNELRSDGELYTQFHDHLAFADAAELGQILASDARVADCLLLKVAQFSLGRRLAVSDGCTLAAVRDAVEDDGLGYQGLLEALVEQDSFAQIRIDEGEG
jgi:hypothetical protein